MFTSSNTSSAEMYREELNFKLGEVPFYGKTRYCFSVTSFRAKVLRLTKPKWISFLIFLHPKQSGSKIFPWACWFYRRFIKHFSKVSKPLCNLLAKDVSFVFDDSCLVAFEKLKQLLTSLLCKFC